MHAGPRLHRRPSNRARAPAYKALGLRNADCWPQGMARTGIEGHVPRHQLPLEPLALRVRLQVLELLPLRGDAGAWSQTTTTRDRAPLRTRDTRQSAASGRSSTRAVPRPLGRRAEGGAATLVSQGTPAPAALSCSVEIWCTPPLPLQV